MKVGYFIIIFISLGSGMANSDHPGESHGEKTGGQDVRVELLQSDMNARLAGNGKEIEEMHRKTDVEKPVTETSREFFNQGKKTQLEEIWASDS